MPSHARAHKRTSRCKPTRRTNGQQFYDYARVPRQAGAKHAQQACERNNRALADTLLYIHAGNSHMITLAHAKPTRQMFVCMCPMRWRECCAIVAERARVIFFCCCVDVCAAFAVNHVFKGVLGGALVQTHLATHMRTSACETENWFSVCSPSSGEAIFFGVRLA